MKVINPACTLSFFTPQASTPRTFLSIINKACPSYTPLRSRYSTTSKMASATSFYDFKPLDSKYFSSHTHRQSICEALSISSREHYLILNSTFHIEKGQPYDLSQLNNKVVLIVNTASKCGFTPQFEGLEKLYKKITTDNKHKDDFVILGFPCNQFAGQDPGDNDTIQSFCLTNYGVSFPILGKTEVNGAKAEPLFEWLKSEAPGLMGMKRVKWNFEKWLVGRDGKVKARWASTTKPEALEADVMKALGAGKSEL